MFTGEHVEKVQKYPPCRLEDINVWIYKNLFFGLAKNYAPTLHKLTLVWKKCPK